MRDPSAALAERPGHIPPDLVVDFDCYEPEGLQDDVQLAWWRAQQNGPDIFWTPRNGGHWVVTRADDITLFQVDNERVSYADFVVPRQPFAPIPPVNLDPPEHGPYRAILMPLLVPKAVSRLESTVRDVAIQTTEALAPRGECEFIQEFAKILPIMVFLRMVDLPFEDRHMLVPLAEAGSRSPDMETRVAAIRTMRRYLSEKMAERRDNPGDDLLSVVVHANLGDRPIAFEEAVSLAITALFGGLDTVTSMLGFCTRFLAMNPKHRQELVDDPGLIPDAVDELIRRLGITNSARRVKVDFEHKGVTFKAGDQVQVPAMLYGLDDRLIDDPLTVDFRRERPIPHAAFGAGIHTCPGAVLARRELRIFLEEWLKRIPDFRIKEGTKPVLASGIVCGVIELRLEW
jgi:cytochrome P450